MNTNDLQSVIRELVGVIDTSSNDVLLNAEGQRAVLRFVARVVHVVEQALQDVYGLAVEVKHIQPGDKAEVARLGRELDLVLTRSHAKSEGICSRLHSLREIFEQDVGLLLRCSPGDPRWHELFWLLDDREGRVIQLVESLVRELTTALDSFGDAGLFGRAKAREEVQHAADEAGIQLRYALRELHEIRDKILGLSGQAGLLELTEDSPEQFRREARALSVKINTGDIYRTQIDNSTVGALAVGAQAHATGTVNLHQGPLTQAQHLEHIKAAKKALVDDEDRLEARVYQALEQFFKSARDVRVESREIAEVQTEMVGILNRVWAEQLGKPVQRNTVSSGLAIKLALEKSLAMVEVTKILLRN